MRTRTFLSLTAIVVAALLVPAPAQAAARVGIDNGQGSATVDPTYATTLELTGRGFQSISGGHGGVYVFFGTVTGAWQPSKGGIVGADYRYVPDDESKANRGFQRFVAFAGSDTAASANGGTVRTDGSWSTELTVPGATFRTLDRSGRAVTVDCRKVTCGVITIGAHGVKNARNETFTPVSFASLDRAKAPATGKSPAPPSTADGVAAEPAAAPAATPAKAADAAAVVDQATAVVGRVLSFTGSGFTPGEQVVATLDDGKAAVGPLSAGTSGEVAGVLQLPSGTTPGTHVLKLTGAASGATPSVNFPIAADRAPTPTAATADEAGVLPDWAPYAFLALTVVALGLAVTFAMLRVRAVRRRHAGSPAATGPEAVHAV